MAALYFYGAVAVFWVTVVVTIRSTSYPSVPCLLDLEPLDLHIPHGREAASGNAIGDEAPTSIQRAKQMNLQQ